MKQSINKQYKTDSTHVNPIKVALFVAFGLIMLAIVFKAGQSNADTRSRASGDCMGQWKTSGRQKVCRNVKNKKGVSREVCSVEMQYYCDESKGANTGGTLRALDGSGVSTPTKPPSSLQAVP